MKSNQKNWMDLGLDLSGTFCHNTIGQFPLDEFLDISWKGGSLKGNYAVSIQNWRLEIAKTSTYHNRFISEWCH